MGTSEQSYGTGVFFVFLATIGWSLSGVFVRIMPGLDGWQLNCWRGYWMAVALMVYLVAVYGRGAYAEISRHTKGGLIRIGPFLCLGINAVCVFPDNGQHRHGFGYWSHLALVCSAPQPLGYG